ncbi:hypothetical protein JCM13664_10060 [Methylothermus subterraneus]
MKNLDSDFPNLIAVTFHLMSFYNLRPCPRLAGKVAQHLELLLEGYGEVFGPWQGALAKMRDHWWQRACLCSAAKARAKLN